MIKILDEKTINKIAAGEVIENPSNVVKELIENDIDANATKINIVLKTDFSLIEVKDNGDGFHKDDIKNAFLLHATSKINEFDDIEKIASFGFRGEALTSISSISKTTLITKNKKEDKGYIYCIDCGHGGEVREYSTSDGTILKIENIFENVPVRKKFLKDGKREMAEALDLVEKYAIAYPNISFKVVIDDKEKLNTVGNGNIEDVLFKLYGKEVVDGLIKLKNVTKGMYDGINIDGYICAPNVIRNTRNEMIYFVNGRYIKSRIISDAIESGFSGYLMEHKFPMTFLKIDIDGDKVDINVHPKKMEVRFSDEEKIYEAVRQEIEYAIIEENEKEITFNLDWLKDEGIYLERAEDKKAEAYDNVGEAFCLPGKQIASPTINKQDASPTESRSGGILPPHEQTSSPTDIDTFLKYKNDKTDATSLLKPDLKRDYIYIGQIFKTYILVEFLDNFYIIDQHAAHEKINYEHLMKEFRETNVKKEMLLLPIILKLTPVEYQVVIDNLERFDKMGFEIEEMSDDTVKVSSIPSIFDKNDKKDFLYELIKDFSDFKNDKNIKYESIEERIASKACRKSIKANDKISEFEARELIKELFTLDNPFNCPHGRPTMIKYTKDEIEKLFGRIV